MIKIKRTALPSEKSRTYSVLWHLADPWYRKGLTLKWVSELCLIPEREAGIRLGELIEQGLVRRNGDLYELTETAWELWGNRHVCVDAPRTLEV